MNKIARRKLADLANYLNGFAKGHEWIGHHPLVSSDNKLAVDEIIGDYLSAQLLR